MGRIHLDTSFLVRAMRVGSAEAKCLGEWLGGESRVAISAMTWAEFLCGPRNGLPTALVRRLRLEVLPIDSQTAAEGARLFNRTGRRRHSLADCMIAASAIRAHAVLATSDRVHFEPMTNYGLQLM